MKIDILKLTAAKQTVRAIAHHERIAILEYLAAHPQSTVHSIYHHHGWEQSVTSNHLKTLRDAGLVTFRTAGKERLYSVNVANLAAVLQATEQLA